ncbi:hypothetical protein [Streptomyces sp. NBC_00299]|uniref:hypothetical protein n=1 Tax=Streptomyces sp. NBC_00299 TaxID=2975705 RepID=UPI002E2CAECB|nr:hypothetical protein [Streptomyces sp. NBC_00299]
MRSFVAAFSVFAAAILAFAVASPGDTGTPESASRFVAAGGVLPPQPDPGWQSTTGISEDPGWQ